MTLQATIPQSPARRAIGMKSLRAMLDRGFDERTLQAMQDVAFRATAQTINHRAARGGDASVKAASSLAEQHVGGPLSSTGDLGPGQSAIYIQYRAMFNQFAPRQALQDALSIALLLRRLPLERERCDATTWLGSTILELRKHAAAVARATPIFAAEIMRSTDEIIEQHPNPQRLGEAIRIAQEVVDAQQATEACLPSPNR